MYPATTGGAHSGTQAIFYSGSGTGASPTYVYVYMLDLSGAPQTLDANSFLEYYVYPQSHADFGSVTSYYSSCVGLNVVFADGTDAQTLGAVDQHGLTIDPNNHCGLLTADTWNYVRVNLGPLAGKVVNRINFGWHHNGANGGFRGYIDDVLLVANGNVASNDHALNASWTPKWNNVVAYWNFDGAGNVANNTNIVSTAGAQAAVAHNGNGYGMSYVNGQVGQGIYLDGNDDYLAIPPSIANSNSLSFSGWVNHMGTTNYERAFDFANATSGSFNAIALVLRSPTYLTGAVSTHTGGGTSVAAPMPVRRDGWTHVAATYDANYIKVYVNGTLAATGTPPRTPAASTGAVGFLGRSSYAVNGDSNTHGVFDEFAFWNTVLDGNDIRVIYERQRASYGGIYTSRVSQATSATQTWNRALAWQTSRPLGKGLPSGHAAESTSDYSSGGTTLNQNLVTMWHFDELGSGTVAGGDFYDDSGYSNTGTAQGTVGSGILVGQTGIAYRGIYLDGSSGYVSSTNLFAEPTTYSLQIWFKTLTTSGGKLMGFGSSATGASTLFDRHIYMENTGVLVYGIYSGGFTYVVSPASYNDGKWHHVVATQNGTVMVLYVDGVQVGTTTAAGNPQAYDGYWRVGYDSLATWGAVPTSYYFNGNLDEVGIWSRALSAAEVLQLYQRSAASFGLQTRYCTASDCSDNPNWVGPDGTSQTFYSESDNRSGSTILAGAPNVTLATLGPGASPYFQYRLYLDSDDSTTQCTYAGSAAPCMPEVKSVSHTLWRYDANSPTVTNTLGTNYYTLSSLTQTLDTTGCAGGVTYNLSANGNTWYYYTGGNWTAANNSLAQSNTAAQLGSTALGAFGTQVGQGQTFFRAYLTSGSSGLLPCALQSEVFLGTQ